MVRDPDWLDDRDISPVQMGILKAIFGEKLSAEELEAFLEVSEGRRPRAGGYFETTILAGVRSGKGDKIGGNVMTYLAITFERDVVGMAPGEVPYIGIVAHGLDGSSQNFGYMEGKARFLEDEKGWEILDHGNAQERAVTGKQIRYKSGVVVQCFPAKKAATRNKTMIGGLADELAWWETDEVKVNADYEICRALKQRMATIRKRWHPKFIKQSSPYLEHGVLYDDFQARDTARRLFVHAPTWVFNPAIDAAVLTEAKEDDFEEYLRDYGAQFGKAGGSYMGAEEVDGAMKRDRPAILTPAPATAYEAAVDTGFRRDRFVLGIAHRTGDRMIVDLVRYWTPEKGAPLDEEEVVRETVEHLKAYNCDTAVADKYGDIQLQNDLRKDDIRLAAERQSTEEHNAVMKNLRSALRRGLIELPFDKAIRDDLLALRKMGNGSAMKIEAPRRKGFYDDISNVLAKLWMKLGPDAGKADLQALNSGAMKERDRLYRDRGFQPPEREDRLPSNFMAQVF